MLLILTSSYSELLSLAAHCSKMLKKKNCLFNETCVPLFHFSSHAPPFMPFCAYLYLVFPHFFFLVLSSPTPTPLPSFWFFYFLHSPSTQAVASLPSTHATKPICTPLLPLTEPTITSLLPCYNPHCQAFSSHA